MLLYLLLVKPKGGPGYPGGPGTPAIQYPPIQIPIPAPAPCYAPPAMPSPCAAPAPAPQIPVTCCGGSSSCQQAVSVLFEFYNFI